MPWEGRHIAWVGEIVEDGLVLCCLAEYLLNAQGRKLWRSDVDDIRVFDRPFLPRYDVLHEVHGHALVRWQILVTVHSQQLQEISVICQKLTYIVNFTLPSVFAAQKLGSHLWVAVSVACFYHGDLAL